MAVKKKVEIINKLGLHARAAAKLVNLASEFTSEIHLMRSEKRVNGKSIMGVMMLAAGKGTIIEVIANGEDEKDAVDKIEELVRQRFGEDV